MFGTIVAGVDGREGGRDALRLAAVLAEATGSELLAACTFPDESAPTRTANKTYRQAMIAASREIVDREIAATGVAARGVLVGDLSVARGLHRLAEQRGAGLIVVGSPQHGRVVTVLFGNIAHNVLNAAPCAVAIAPADYVPRSPAAIGVGFDGGPEARRALTLAADLARQSGARLEVVTAVERWVPMPAPPMGVVDLDAVHERERRDAQERLDDALRDLGVDASAETVGGPPGPVLTELSRRVDLLVLGSRGWGPIHRLVTGSTSHAMVAHAECPLLVLPRGAEPGDAADALETMEVSQEAAEPVASDP